MSQYYYLVSGLPELSPDDHRVPVSMTELKELLIENLSAADLELIKLFFLKYDNQNLLAYLASSESELNALGNLSGVQLGEIIRENKELERPAVPAMPPYFVPFLQAYLADKQVEQFPELSAEDQLASLYYDYACQCDNPFIANFFRFMLNVKNILIAHQCRISGYDLSQTIVGDNDIARLIRTSNAKDFGLSGELDYLDDVLQIAEEENLLEREMNLDELIWNYLDENSFFHYFSVERVFTYLIKIDMLGRWENMRRQDGQTVFRRVIGGYKKAYRFADEFKV
ncbi:DUF2764 family protein [Mangrovibacterium marinum]|uniref:Uncharacterized protein DUF2764 n=1 Tax=Mangrovibacterium marinum TaxID=1639118 RepID=A0A2T5C0R9_9BACT|nr:DUF2764 family protein [Mangrovibacterium marinum]PTN08205.1 uncharacterized protein DUF2764 [Mangrovibacterium marinum]